MQISFNSDALDLAAAKAGDTTRGGRINYARISRRSGIDSITISRVHRRLHVPDLKTVLGMARAYGLTVEDLVSITNEAAAAA